MHNYKSIVLPMDYSNRNPILRKLSSIFCTWGYSKTIKTRDGKIIGAPSPLWANPSSLFFKIFSVINLICCCLFIGCYIFLRYYNNDQEISSLTVRDYTNLPKNVTFNEFVNLTKETNSTSTNVEDAYCMYKSYNEVNAIFVIIGAVILFLNFFHTMNIGFILDYASDNEWFRTLILNFILWLLMSGWLIGDIIYSSYLINYYNDNYSSNSSSSVFRMSTTKCNNLFKVNSYGYLVVGIVTAVLAIFQIVKIFLIFKRFFMTDYVEHTARCEDENIIVIS